MALVYLTRRETLSACHRLHSKHLSDEENKKIFDKVTRFTLVLRLTFLLLNSFERI